MTTRLKTTEWAFQTNFATLASATPYTFTSMTVAVPETTPVFKSVYLEIISQADVTAASSSTTHPTVKLQLASVAQTTYSLGVDTTNGEQVHTQWTGYWVQDVTAYFTTNWTGTSMSSNIVVQFPYATQCQAARLVVTYYYSDAGDTRCKTVRIPLEGQAGAIPTSLTQIDTNGIPNLSTFCPEGSVSFQNVHLEITYIANNSAGSAFVPTWEVDSTTQAEPTHQITGAGFGDYTTCRIFWQQNSLSTTTTHTFSGSSSVASTVWNVCVILVATYTYSESGTSTVLNSVIIPFNDAQMGANCNALARQAAWTTSWYVEEPATITLVQSAVRLGTLSQNTNVAYDPFMISAGSQSYRSFAHPQQGFVGVYGEANFQQRVDSGGVQGAAFTFAAGLNTLTLSVYGNGSGDDSAVGVRVLLYLNYTSGKNATYGTAVHNKTVRHLLVSTQNGYATNGDTDFGILTPVSPPETSWWNNGTMFAFAYSNCNGANWLTQLQTGEQQGTGEIIFGNAARSFGGGQCESILNVIAGNGRIWDRNSSEVDTNRLNPFVGRRWMNMSYLYSGMKNAVECWYTYHSIQYAASGTLTGYTGSGSGITVNLHLASTGELVGTTTSATGGTFSIPWWDNQGNVFVEARQDGTHLGRSDQTTAS